MPNHIQFYVQSELVCLALDDLEGSFNYTLQIPVTLHCAVHWQHLALMGVQIAEVNEERLFIG
jgi:hypothetical protein